MTDQETITIPLSVYEDMVERYFRAKGRIMDLELEIFELQEELSGLKEISGYTPD